MKIKESTIEKFGCQKENVRALVEAMGHEVEKPKRKTKQGQIWAYSSDATLRLLTYLASIEKWAFISIDGPTAYLGEDSSYGLFNTAQRLMEAHNGLKFQANSLEEYYAKKVKGELSP